MGRASAWNQLVFFFFLTLLINSSQSTIAQINITDSVRGQKALRVKTVVHKAGAPSELLYDFGKGRFLVDSADSNGAWSVVELTEEPGYKTPLHRHSTWDEAFYVLQGTLTAKIADSVYTLTAGSFILIPRGTPHGQANLQDVPVKLLLTITPSGFEQHLKDRVELFKTIKPNSAEFPKRMDLLRKKNARYIEVLGTWE